MSAHEGCTCPAGSYDYPNAAHTDYCALRPYDPPRFYEVARLEHDGRTLVCYGASDGGYMIANEDDIARQSVVLTNYELRWLAELWRPTARAGVPATP